MAAALLDLLRVLRRLALAAIVGLVVGTACALFLWALDRATTARFAHPWLLYLLPLAGVAVALLYRAVGGESERGTDLIVEAIHAPGAGGARSTHAPGASADAAKQVGETRVSSTSAQASVDDATPDRAAEVGVPARLAPLVLLGTVVTHLFGGSAGREGTAIQMGGSLAASVARLVRASPELRRLLLTCGVAGGFGAVFGTPLAGAVFAIEVLTVGRVRYDALLPCLVASVVGDLTCARGWGAHHTPYPLAIFGADPAAAAVAVHGPSAGVALRVAVAGIAFGLAGLLFVTLTHRLKAALAAIVPAGRAYLRPAVAGVAVIALVWLTGTRDYLGLGVRGEFADSVTIPGAFTPGGAAAFSWLWKLVFTSVTLAGGFKGGEVTPLFFIGATLGHALAAPLGVPVDLMAALGFVAVFGGATKTPLACTIMGVELFAATGGHAVGSGLVVYLAIACTIAFLTSGRRGIYATQRRED